jgi:hypothetical protein
MTYTLTPEQIDMLSDALTQYADNNDPDECIDPITTSANQEKRIRRSHALAVELRDKLAEHFASMAG